jgi:hypothetical protein
MKYIRTRRETPTLTERAGIAHLVQWRNHGLDDLRFEFRQVKDILGPVHTSVISSGQLAAASYLRLGKPRCIDLIHTCLRPRCDDLRSRGYRKSLRLRSGTVSQMRVLIAFLAVE